MMIEAEKMLHLRRYLTLIVRSSRLYSSRCKSAKSRPSRCEGYVFGYVHPRHTSLRPEVYVATCNRTCVTTVLQSSQSDVVDHKLMSFCDDVKKGRISADGLREVIDLCSKNDYQLPHDTGVLLLKCCGNLLPDLEAAERDNLANQIWRLIKKNGGVPTLEYYNTLLSVSEENFKIVNPKNFLATMNVEPDENTYRLLLNAATKVGNSEYLWDILHMTKDKNVTIHEETIIALAQICMANGNIAEAERLVMLMQKAKLSTAKVYTELACGYAKLGDVPNLIKILNEEPQSNADLLRIVKTLSMSNNSRHIPVVLNFLMPSVPAIKPEISRTITELIRADRVVDAHTIINCLAANNVTKDIVQDFVNNFINELMISNVPINDVIKYANEFVDSGYNQHLLTDVAEIGLKLGRENLCLAVFRAMRNKNIEIRPHYYWPLLLTVYHNKGEAAVFSLLKSMINQGVEIDSDTLLHYVLPYINTANPIITVQKLQLINVPTPVLYTPLLSFLLQHNRLQDLTSLCLHYTRYTVYYKELIKPLVRTYLATRDIKTCIMLLMAFSQGQDFVSLFLMLLLKAEYPIYIEDLLLFLEGFRKCGVKISQNEATVLKNKLEQNKNLHVTTNVANLIDNMVDPDMKSSIYMLHPKYMNTKELTCYITELKSNKACTRDILQRLLIAYQIENNLKKAEEIKQEYDACQYEWSPKMKSLLFELYLKHNKLNEAEALLPDLQIMPSKFQINNIKIVMYAIALVKADKPTKAFDVIDTFDGVDTKSDSQAQCCTLLQTLAQSQHHAYTKDMLDLLLEKNYCRLTTELLKPLVAIPLERNDILDAVNVFKECAQKYKKTPLILEVLTALLEQKYSSKLPNVDDYINQVYDTVATIYSVYVANTFLALALATLNKTEKLQALLQTHKLSTTYLVNYIKEIKTNSALDGLQNLLVAGKYLDDNLIYNALLSVYSKMGDCNRALELWEIMCMKNIKPNKEFEKSFIQFLSSNKVPLPSELNRIQKKH